VLEASWPPEGWICWDILFREISQAAEVALKMRSDSFLGFSLNLQNEHLLDATSARLLDHISELAFSELRMMQMGFSTGQPLR
jgi:hypothetical protein